VVVRAALDVNPQTAQVTVKSDPLPTILQGIPLDLRSIAVNADRPGFTLNPTNCEPMAVGGEAIALAGQSALLSDRFQVGGCRGLGFAPNLNVRLFGGVKRNKYPALRAVLEERGGDSNIARAAVTLPHSVFLAQNHINTVCTRAQFADDKCPPGSIYGHAKAITPLLDAPLSGPVYLRSSSNPLPDLVVALRGQVKVELDGRIDSVNGGIRTTFDAAPDAPVTKFILEMKGGKKGLLVNSRDLCENPSRAVVRMNGQNGKVHDFSTLMKNRCR
jgi:hypothetical protein